VRARRHIGVLVRHDLRYTLSSARGLLFLIFFAMVWGWVLWKLATGWAEWLLTPAAGFAVTWAFDSGLAQMLHDKPVTLAAYFVVAATFTPLFAVLASCDQTATDLGTRHIRFLIPRVGRAEIFVSRLIGASILIAAAQLLAGLAATIVALVIHGGDFGAGAIIAYGARVTVTLILYSLPIVALMSLVSAAMGSIALALLVGAGGYGLLAIVLGMLPGTAGTILGFLIPGGLKPYLVHPEIGPALAACAATFGYVALYACLGWQVFRRRDA
jgi:hypothetical protein